MCDMARTSSGAAGTPDRRLAAPSSASVGGRIAAWGLVVLMALGSVFMWLGSPVLWLWVVSQGASSSQPSAGAYLLVLGLIVLTAVVIGKALAALDRLHTRIVFPDRDGRRRTAWLKSMRDDRSTQRPQGVLDVVMIWSVGTALLLTAIWFAFFAGSSLIG